MMNSSPYAQGQNTKEEVMKLTIVVGKGEGLSVMDCFVVVGESDGEYVGSVGI